MLDFCKKNNYTCIDLDGLTMDLYNKLGEKESEKFHMIFEPNKFENYLEGKDDHTHLVPEGALMVSTLFVNAIKNTNDPLKDLMLEPEEQDEFDKYMLKD